MNAHGSIRFPAVIAFFWWIAGLGFDISADAPRASEGIVITLRDKAAVQGRVVTIADVADITGGSEVSREKIGRLDLVEFGAASSAAIRQKQVLFRLRLADFPTKLLRIEGAEETIVAAVRIPVSADSIFETAKASALKRLALTEEDLSVRLVQPITAPIPAVTDLSEVMLKAEPHTANVAIGRVQMDVTMLVRGEKKFSLPVYLEIRPVQAVAIAKRALIKNETVSGDNAQADRRVVDAGTRPANPTTLAGRTLKRGVFAGQVIMETDLESSEPEAGRVIIKNRQNVKMVYRLPVLNVIHNGESQQEGKLGDRIRVQNLDSKKIIVGKVIGPDTVEVD